MTAIFYPDRETTSKSGRFTLEARSPHNGTILGRDGTRSTDAFSFKYREHQSEFRYRLLDHKLRQAGSRADAGVVWERFQGAREDSPHEVVVSDDGWAIIRTHGFSPELIAVGIDGRDVLRIKLVSASDVEEEKHPQGPAWKLEHLAFTTAGHYWAANSWRNFLSHQGRAFFSWRASWGQRLVLDLEYGTAFTDEAPLPDGLSAAVIDSEKAGVRSLLSGLSGQTNEVRDLLAPQSEADFDDRGELRQGVGQASSALHLVGVHRMRDCVPFLREWEVLDVPAFRTGTTAMPRGWSLQTQLFRPIVHNSLRLLGEEPAGFPAYGFVMGYDSHAERFQIPDHIPDRAGRAKAVNQGMSAAEVLRLIGSPDFLRRKSRQEGWFYVWPEDWEYDFKLESGWATLRIRWEEKKRKGVLTEIQWIEPYWLGSDEREAEFLRW